MGPTGAGKSEPGWRWIWCGEIPLEIVSVDSALVYRGMDIGAAKPQAGIRARIPHHLIDIRDAAEHYSAGEFVRDAGRVLQDIWSRGRQPLLVGGTMLYFHALTQGIAQLQQALMPRCAPRSMRARQPSRAGAAAACGACAVWMQPPKRRISHAP